MFKALVVDNFTIFSVSIFTGIVLASWPWWKPVSQASKPSPYVIELASVGVFELKPKDSKEEFGCSGMKKRLRLK